VTGLAGLLMISPEFNSLPVAVAANQTPRQRIEIGIANLARRECCRRRCAFGRVSDGARLFQRMMDVHFMGVVHARRRYCLDDGARHGRSLPSHPPPSRATPIVSA